jgi:hypothetical protein
MSYQTPQYLLDNYAPLTHQWRIILSTLSSQELPQFVDGVEDPITSSKIRTPRLEVTGPLGTKLNSEFGEVYDPDTIKQLLKTFLVKNKLMKEEQENIPEMAKDIFLKVCAAPIAARLTNIGSNEINLRVTQNGVPRDITQSELNWFISMRHDVPSNRFYQRPFFPTETGIPHDIGFRDPYGRIVSLDILNRLYNLFISSERLMELRSSMPRSGGKKSRFTSRCHTRTRRTKRRTRRTRHTRSRRN